MTDNEADSTDKPAPSKKQRRRHVRRRATAQPDYLLGMFTNMAENGAEFGVTLTVGGSVVTGVMVGRREWLRRLIEAHEELAFLSGVQKAWDEQRAEEAEEHAGHEDDLDYLEPFETMIHVVNARYMSDGGGIPSGQGMFWRGLLAEVDGWSFGSFS